MSEKAPDPIEDEHMSFEREVDWGLILDANSNLQHGIDLRRYRAEPEVKMAVQRARDALAELIDVFNAEVYQPAWRAYQTEEYRRQQVAEAST